MEIEFKLKKEPPMFDKDNIFHKVQIKWALKSSSTKQKQKYVAKEIGIEPKRVKICTG